MSDKCKDIWVYVETDDDGTALGGVELLQTAKELAESSGGTVSAVVAGENIDSAANEAGEYGADRVLALCGPGLSKSPLKAMHANLKSSFPSKNRKRSSSRAAVLQGPGRNAGLPP